MPEAEPIEIPLTLEVSKIIEDVKELTQAFGTAFDAGSEKATQKLNDLDNKMKILIQTVELDRQKISELNALKEKAWGEERIRLEQEIAWIEKRIVLHDREKLQLENKIIQQKTLITNSQQLTDVEKQQNIELSNQQQAANKSLGDTIASENQLTDAVNKTGASFGNMFSGMITGLAAAGLGLQQLFSYIREQQAATNAGIAEQNAQSLADIDSFKLLQSKLSPVFKAANLVTDDTQPAGITAVGQLIKKTGVDAAIGFATSTAQGATLAGKDPIQTIENYSDIGSIARRIPGGLAPQTPGGEVYKEALHNQESEKQIEQLFAQEAGIAGGYGEDEMSTLNTLLRELEGERKLKDKNGKPFITDEDIFSIYLGYKNQGLSPEKSYQYTVLQVKMIVRLQARAAGPQGPKLLAAIGRTSPTIASELKSGTLTAKSFVGDVNKLNPQQRLSLAGDLGKAGAEGTAALELDTPADYAKITPKGIEETLPNQGEANRDEAEYGKYRAISTEASSGAASTYDTFKNYEEFVEGRLRHDNLFPQNVVGDAATEKAYTTFVIYFKQFMRAVNYRNRHPNDFGAAKRVQDLGNFLKTDRHFNIPGLKALLDHSDTNKIIDDLMETNLADPGKIINRNDFLQDYHNNPLKALENLTKTPVIPGIGYNEHYSPSEFPKFNQDSYENLLEGSDYTSNEGANDVTTDTQTGPNDHPTGLGGGDNKLAKPTTQPATGTQPQSSIINIHRNQITVYGNAFDSFGEPLHIPNHLIG